MTTEDKIKLIIEGTIFPNKAAKIKALKKLAVRLGDGRGGDIKGWREVQTAIFKLEWAD